MCGSSMCSKTENWCYFLSLLLTLCLLVSTQTDSPDTPKSFYTPYVHILHKAHRITTYDIIEIDSQCLELHVLSCTSQLNYHYWSVVLRSDDAYKKDLLQTIWLVYDSNASNFNKTHELHSVCRTNTHTQS